ncbi:hypothetical protein AAFO92_13890 [Roseovarius sp. CAU 1744]|uniref:hypothetical protein n=1 Tax=Roseovarius sp. CAU 1744 TaxID=3140368 RepID=UPI00325AA185
MLTGIPKDDSIEQYKRILEHAKTDRQPVVRLQLTGLALIFFWPPLATWLPSLAYQDASGGR